MPLYFNAAPLADMANTNDLYRSVHFVTLKERIAATLENAEAILATSHDLIERLEAQATITDCRGKALEIAQAVAAARLL